VLLSSTEFRNQLEHSLQNSDDEILVLSGFIKANALRWMLGKCGSTNAKVVSRWRKHDLICGASDFECYNICKEFGVDFGVSQNLHGKVYSVDGNIFVGSANLTNRGMAFSNNYNDEFGVGFTAGESDRSKLNSYLHDVIWLNDSLADSIHCELDETPHTKQISELDWSASLKAQLARPVRHLWMHELLFSKPGDLLTFNAKDEYQIHDFEVLGLDIDNLNRARLTSAFKTSNCFRWLDQILRDEKSLSFGRVSKLLHDAVLDDPVPYRKDIKQLVANLYSWFELSENHKISQPRHSQIIERLD